MTEMSERQPLPPPFGVSRGPSWPTAKLLVAYREGAAAGSSADAHIEGLMLMASDHPVAVRVGDAFIVRGDDVPAVAAGVHAALCRVLQAAGIDLAPDESVLAGAVASELAVPRGFEWTLWARDPDATRTELLAWAIGDMPALGESGWAPKPADAEIDAVLRDIERGR